MLIIINYYNNIIVCNPQLRFYSRSKSHFKCTHRFNKIDTQSDFILSHIFYCLRAVKPGLLTVHIWFFQPVLLHNKRFRNKYKIQNLARNFPQKPRNSRLIFEKKNALIFNSMQSFNIRSFERMPSSSFCRYTVQNSHFSIFFSSVLFFSNSSLFLRFLWVSKDLHRCSAPDGV